MTRKAPSYGDIDIAEEVRRSTEASGVPYHVEDGPTLDRLARMFASAIKAQAKTRRGNDGFKQSQEGRNE